MATPKYALLVGTTPHNAVIIATGIYDKLDGKRKRIRRADRCGKLHVEMMRVEGGPGGE